MSLSAIARLISSGLSTCCSTSRSITRSAPPMISRTSSPRAWYAKHHHLGGGTTPLRPVVVLHLGVRNSLHRLRRFPIPQRAPVVNCDTRSFDHSAKPCEAAPRQACAAGTVLPARSKRLSMDALSDVLRAVRLTDRAPSDVSVATITIEGCISSEGSNERRRIRTLGAPVSLRATSRSHS